MGHQGTQKNILSIDLESWIHFYNDALKEKPNKDSDKRKQLDKEYIVRATTKILDILDQYHQKATFFIIGEIYEWYPGLISEIQKRGHEIGYHTHYHPIIKSGKILDEEIKRSKKFIKKYKIKGFRAPQIFMTNDAMKVLHDNGFTYSSSSYQDHKIQTIEGVKEIPVSTLTFRGKKVVDSHLPKNLSIPMLTKKIPFGSGLFIALFGSFISRFIKKVNKKNMPAILFIHPWQVYRHKKIHSFLFKCKLMFKNPLCIPYTRIIVKDFKKLLKRHKFVSFEEYYNG